MQQIYEKRLALMLCCKDRNYRRMWESHPQCLPTLGYNLFLHLLGLIVSRNSLVHLPTNINFVRDMNLTFFKVSIKIHVLIKIKTEANQSNQHLPVFACFQIISKIVTSLPALTSQILL